MAEWPPFSSSPVACICPLVPARASGVGYSQGNGAVWQKARLRRLWKVPAAAHYPPACRVWGAAAQSLGPLPRALAAADGDRAAGRALSLGRQEQQPWQQRQQEARGRPPHPASPGAHQPIAPRGPTALGPSCEQAGGTRRCGRRAQRGPRAPEGGAGGPGRRQALGSPPPRPGGMSGERPAGEDAGAAVSAAPAAPGGAARVSGQCSWAGESPAAARLLLAQRWAGT